MIFLGADPDLHCTGLALADEHQVYAVDVIKISETLKGADAVVAMCEAIGLGLSGWLDMHFPSHKIGPGLGYVVEAQEVYLGGSKPKGTPEDLLNLANVTGALLGQAAQWFNFSDFEAKVFRPLPKTWTGSFAKQVQQARTCQELAWQYELRGSNPRTGYVRPLSFAPYVFPNYDTLKVTDWHTIMDAIGLARWGAKRAARDARLDKRAAERAEQRDAP